ncbi:MAG: hypothetical protein ACE5HF_06695, partial [Gemmatimonadota bacterium]
MGSHVRPRFVHPARRKGAGMLALLLPVVGSACATESSGGAARLEATIDTVDGVERLSYPATHAAGLAWHFDTVAVIGGFGSDDDRYQFDDVTPAQLAGSPEGDLYVADPSGHRILRYDAAGRFVSSFGREGSGPGELESPSGVDLGPGDTLWITDSANRRTTLIPVAGGAPRSIPMEDDASVLAGRIAVRGARFFGVNRVFSFTPGQQPESAPPYRLVSFDGTGMPHDSIWVSPGPKMT